MLTDEETNLVRRIFAQGPGILLDAGYTLETAPKFMERPDVKATLELLSREMAVSDVTASRTKFLGRRALAPLLNPAVATVARALLGPTYARDKNGVVLRDTKGNFQVTDPGPNGTQISAATDVLDRMNITPESKVAMLLDGGDMVMRVLPVVSSSRTLLENPQLGATEEERALARERIRNTIMSLLPSVRTIKAEVDAKLIEVASVRSGARRKGVKKKSHATTPNAPAR